jgi:hypothetical protein
MTTTTTTTPTAATPYREQHTRGVHNLLWLFPAGGVEPQANADWYRRLDAIKSSAISLRLTRAVAEHNRSHKATGEHLQVLHGVNHLGIQCRKVGLFSLAKAVLLHAVEGADPVAFADELVARLTDDLARADAGQKADRLIETVRNARDALTALGAKYAEESLALEIEQVERRLAALTTTFATVATEAAAAALGADDAFDDVGEDAPLVAELTRASVAETPLTFRPPLARPLFMPTSSSGADFKEMRAALIERLMRGSP